MVILSKVGWVNVTVVEIEQLLASEAITVYVVATKLVKVPVALLVLAGKIR